jgi:hypothetical protein
VGHLAPASGVFTASVTRTHPARPIAALLVAGVFALTLTACDATDTAASVPEPSASSAAPAASDSAVPEPGRTIEASDVAPAGDLQGIRIAVVVPDDGAASVALRDAVRAFAAAQGLVLDEFAATADAASLDSAFRQALATEPHVVVGLGAGIVDEFAYESSQWLDQEFLLLGAQVAEPTSNVTAVIWDGATSRGSGAPADGDLDDTTVTAARATQALTAGLASVLAGTSGVVLRLS